MNSFLSWPGMGGGGEFAQQRRKPFSLWSLTRCGNIPVSSSDPHISWVTGRPIQICIRPSALICNNSQAKRHALYPMARWVVTEGQLEVKGYFTLYPMPSPSHPYGATWIYTSDFACSQSYPSPVQSTFLYVLPKNDGSPPPFPPPDTLFLPLTSLPGPAQTHPLWWWIRCQEASVHHCAGLAYSWVASSMLYGMFVTLGAGAKGLPQPKSQ